MSYIFASDPIYDKIIVFVKSKASSDKNIERNVRIGTVVLQIWSDEQRQID